MKKVAIPLKDNVLCGHFGHSDVFTVFTTEGQKIVTEEQLVPPPHEPGVIPVWLHEQGVTDVIAGGIGQRAIQILNDNKINVYVGVAPKDSRELVNDLLNDTLVAGVNLCDH